MTYTLTKGEPDSTIEHTLTDDDGEPVDLHGTRRVRFKLWIPGDRTPQVDAEASVVDAGAGRVRYEFDRDDLRVVGWYSASYWVRDADGRLSMYPTDSVLDVKVTAPTSPV